MLHGTSANHTLRSSSSLWWKVARANQKGVLSMLLTHTGAVLEPFHRQLVDRSVRACRDFRGGLVIPLPARGGK